MAKPGRRVWSGRWASWVECLGGDDLLRLRVEMELTDREGPPPDKGVRLLLLLGGEGD